MKNFNFRDYLNILNLFLYRLKNNKKGKLEGIKERNYSIAKSLKSSGFDNQFISKHTGLSVEEIEKL